MQFHTEVSPLDLSVAAEEIPEHLRCTECGRRCIGVVIRVAGDERKCNACFKLQKQNVIAQESVMMPIDFRRHRGKVIGRI